MIWPTIRIFWIASSRPSTCLYFSTVKSCWVVQRDSHSPVTQWHASRVLELTVKQNKHLIFCISTWFRFKSTQCKPFNAGHSWIVVYCTSTTMWLWFIRSLFALVEICVNPCSGLRGFASLGSHTWGHASTEKGPTTRRIHRRSTKIWSLVRRD